MADTRLPLEVYDDRPTAEREAEQTWAPLAKAQGYDVEVRPVQRIARMSRTSGHYVQAGPFGVYLVEPEAEAGEGEGGAQRRPRARGKRRPKAGLGMSVLGAPVGAQA